MSYFKVMGKIKSENAMNALYSARCTQHIHERIERASRTAYGIGNVCAGFIVDKKHENGLEEHYITTTGIIVVLNHNTKRAVTMMIARPAQIKRYYKAMGHIAPSRIVKIAAMNEKMGYNY